ncbi:hypothetical protein IJD44_03285 [bacterium]|nr:hypothetical protein [bacterium]
MRINNKFNNYKTSFNGIDKKETKMTEKNEDMKFLLNACKEGLHNAAELKVPENGQFGRVSVGFVIPDSNNKGLLYITHSEENPKTQRLLSVGVHHKNSDRVISNLLLDGNKQEILEYLKSEENTQSIVDIINGLSDKTDEFYSSL